MVYMLRNEAAKDTFLRQEWPFHHAKTFDKPLFFQIPTCRDNSKEILEAPGGFADSRVRDTN